MNSDGISRLNFLRQLYETKTNGNSSEVVRELQQIKTEVKIANDERVRDDAPLTNATKSPYLPDQMFFKKDVVYNSAEETKWKDVKTSDQVEKETQENYLESNLRKLNVI
ncbi:MAG: hypothetical protein Q7U04_09000 [Bacteriovorax sp.]|nr:hypothetical protein [Bacteriovorax sp.]